MTEMPRFDGAVPLGVPEFDLADRMRKALRESKVGVQEMADYLDVARETVSTWINGRIPPSTQTVRLFAMRTGVDYRWLKTGTVTGSNGGLYTAGDLNPEPADSTHSVMTNVIPLEHGRRLRRVHRPRITPPDVHPVPVPSAGQIKSA